MSEVCVRCEAASALARGQGSLTCCQQVPMRHHEAELHMVLPQHVVAISQVKAL
jgi:hypothetical protein